MFTHLDTFEQTGGVEVFGSWAAFAEVYLIPRVHRLSFPIHQTIHPIMSAAPPMSQGLPRQSHRNALHDLGAHHSYHLEWVRAALDALELHLSIVIELDSYHIPAIGAFEGVCSDAPGYPQRAQPHVLYRLR